VSEDVFLSDDFLRQLISVGEVDLLVAIPSHNDRETIVQVVRAVEKSLLREFRRERVVLLNIDGGSKDGTPQAILEASSSRNETGIESLRTLRWITTKNGNGAAPGNILRMILAAADLSRAKGCAVISGSAENATPAWVDSLLKPVYRENFDFVAPLYSRQKFDGLLTRHLLYPLSRALYGRPIRELRASEFAFSGRLATHCLSREEWRHEGVQAGAEMWMAITAMSNGFRCCQTYLGPKPRATAQAGVVEAIRQTVSGLFWCVESTDEYWAKGSATEPLRTAGPDHELTNESVRIDRKKLIGMYRSGVADLSQILGTIVGPETHAELVRLAALDDNAFRLSNATWVHTIYEFAAAYHHSVLNRDHLVQAFIPIYRGRVYSFLTQHRNSKPDAMETELEDLCQEFERQKAFFIERWKTKGQGAS
jgi:glucosylglycerate synthase